MGFMGWIGWLIAVVELVVIVLWWQGGALDSAKADAAIADSAKQAESSVLSFIDRFKRKDK
jgi:hypothetical protein